MNLFNRPILSYEYAPPADMPSIDLHEKALKCLKITNNFINLNDTKKETIASVLMNLSENNLDNILRELYEYGPNEITKNNRFQILRDKNV